MTQTATISDAAVDTIPKTMRGWAVDSFGGPEKLRRMELPVPRPGDREILIRMFGAEVGDWDILVRDGGWPMGRPFPLVLGLAGAGTVAAIGRKLCPFAVGESVYTYSYPLYDNGAWAEYMLVPESYVARAPSALNLVAAGAVPIAGLTAHETLTDILNVEQGDVVLITAAAGGVGHLAVQIARQLGARVVGTASTHNLDFVRRLGAEIVIDYSREDFVAGIRRHFPGGVDKALNCVAGATADEVVEALAPSGRMVDLTGSAAVARSDVSADTDYLVRADGKRLAVLARMFDEGKLKLHVDEIVPFDRAPDALEIVAGKHVRGKIVLSIE